METVVTSLRVAPVQEPERHLSRPPLGWGFRAFPVILFIAAVSAGIAFAYLLLATRLQSYDDEGYVLLSLAQYFKSGHLYRDVYSQYGPFLFLAGDFLFRVLHIPLNHDGGRLVTFVSWTAAALLGGWAVYISTTRLALGAAACGCLFVLGAVLANEPMHPQFIVVLLSAIVINLGFAKRQNRAAVALGAAGALLVLTKVNVGAFFAIALLQTILIQIPKSWFRTAGLWMTGLFASLLPYLLMRSHLAANWSFCVLTTACIASVSLIGAQVRVRTRLPLSTLWRAAAGGFFAAIVVVGFALLRGSTLLDLFRGVVLWNLRQPDIFNLAAHASAPVAAWDVLAPVSAALLCVLLLSARTRLAGWETPLYAICFAAGLIAAGLCVSKSPFLALPVLPLGFVPILLREDLSSRALYGRLFVLNWCALGFLQVWPVAGSQVQIAAFPLLIWAFLLMSDGLEGLFLGSRRSVENRLPAVQALTGLAAIVLLLVAGRAAVKYELAGGRVLRDYLTDPASSLAGAHFLHLPPAQEDTDRFLAASVKQNCDVLFTLPGMGSFNFWSSTPPPNGWNATAWVKQIDLSRQQEILEVLAAHPNSCVIENARLLNVWQTNVADVRAAPLGNYVLQQMPAVAERDGYVLRVHPERKSPWIELTSSY